MLYLYRIHDDVVKRGYAPVDGLIIRVLLLTRYATPLLHVRKRTTGKPPLIGSLHSLRSRQGRRDYLDTLDRCKRE